MNEELQENGLEELEEFEEFDETEVKSASIKDLDKFEQQMKNMSQQARISRAHELSSLVQTGCAKRYLICVLENSLASMKLCKTLLKQLDDISDDLKPLILSVCSNHVGKLSESQQKILFNAAVPFINSAFVQTFFVSFFQQSTEVQQIRFARKLTKQVLYTEGASYKKLVTIFKNQSNNFVLTLVKNFIREFTIYQQQCRAGKSPMLFSAVKKINRTTKKQTKVGNVSVEEKCAERLASEQLFEFISLQTVLINQLTSEQVKQLQYPLVEMTLYCFSYLINYPRAFPFILHLILVLTKHLNCYIPFQQLFIQIIVYCALPLSKSSLDVNPQQYKAKLFDENGVVTFKKHKFVPQQFTKTLQFREAVLKLAFQSIYLYFVKQLKMQPVCFPEATNGFRLQLNEVQKSVEGKEISEYTGYKISYKGFQFGFQKKLVQDLKNLKQNLQKDADFVVEKRKNVDLADAAKIVFDGEFEVVKEAEKLFLIEEEKEVEEEVQSQTEKLEQIEEIEEMEEFEEFDEQEGDQVKELML